MKVKSSKITISALLAVLACEKTVTAASAYTAAAPYTVARGISSSVPKKFSLASSVRLSAAVPSADIQQKLKSGEWEQVEILLNGQLVGTLTAASLTPENVEANKIPINLNIPFTGKDGSTIELKYVMTDKSGKKTTRPIVIFWDEEQQDYGYRSQDEMSGTTLPLTNCDMNILRNE